MGKSKKFQKETDGKFERRLEPRKTKHLPYGTKPNVASKNSVYSGHNEFVYIPGGGEFYIKDIDKSWAREENKRITKSELNFAQQLPSEFDLIEEEYYEDVYDIEYGWRDNDISDEDYEKFKHLIINNNV